LKSRKELQTNVNKYRTVVRTPTTELMILLTTNFSHQQMLDESQLEARVNERETKHTLNFDCECFFIFPIFRLLVYGACRSQQVNVGK